jgi:hypothetical protein
MPKADSVLIIDTSAASKMSSAVLGRLCAESSPPLCCRFVSSLEKDLTMRQKTTEVSVSDFSSGSYSTLLQEEVKVSQICLFGVMLCPAALSLVCNPLRSHCRILSQVNALRDTWNHVNRLVPNNMCHYAKLYRSAGNADKHKSMTCLFLKGAESF